MGDKWLLCEWRCWIWHFVNNCSGSLPIFFCWNDFTIFSCSKWTIRCDCQCFQLPEYMCRGKLFPLLSRQKSNKGKRVLIIFVEYCHIFYSQMQNGTIKWYNLFSYSSSKSNCCDSQQWFKYCFEDVIS